MKICIDCTPLLVNSAGVKTYLYHLAGELIALDSPHEIVPYPTGALPSTLQHSVPAWSRIPNAARALFALHFGGPCNPLMGMATRRAAVFHASNLIRHVPKRMVLTTTVHDLTALCLPALHRPATIEADRRFFAGTVTQARRVIAVSNSTKRDLMSLLHLPESKISVIYPGVSGRYFERDSAAARIVQEKYGLRSAYLIFVGTIEPRKNLDRLLDAYVGMLPSIRDEFQLVIAGMPGWLDSGVVNRLRQGVPGVRWLEYVPEQDLPALVGGATLSVYPSLYEGFGFPVVEAMAAGVPVLTSNCSSLPEVAGDCACLVDPLSVTEIRTSMERLLTSPGERGAMAQRGLARALHYSWAETARQTLQFFEQTVPA